MPWPARRRRSARTSAADDAAVARAGPGARGQDPAVQGCSTGPFGRASRPFALLTAPTAPSEYRPCNQPLDGAARRAHAAKGMGLRFARRNADVAADARRARHRTIGPATGQPRARPAQAPPREHTRSSEACSANKNVTVRRSVSSVGGLLTIDERDLRRDCITKRFRWRVGASGPERTAGPDAERRGRGPIAATRSRGRIRTSTRRAQDRRPGGERAGRRS